MKYCLNDQSTNVMTIKPSGQAIISSKIDGETYVIQADELDWDQIIIDDRSMGPEIRYHGYIDHLQLGELSWSVSEYPIGMRDYSSYDINGHTLEENFSFDTSVENDTELDDIDDEGLKNITDDQLKSFPLYKQQEYIIDWFHTMYWDPAHETPYDGREGGYQYIHGGPYDAKEELEAKFGGVVEENVIERAVDEIEAGGILEWAPSPAHPDQLAAAEEYYESLRPQTLDEIRAALESGAEFNLESPAAQAAAATLKQSVDALKAALDARRPSHGGFGHNGPALDDEGNLLPDDFENELRETANLLSVQMETTSPDPMVVVEAASRLRRFRIWLQPRIDLAADEFAKEIGKKGGAALVAVGTIALASIVPGLNTVIAAAWNWLQAIFL